MCGHVCTLCKCAFVIDRSEWLPKLHMAYVQDERLSVLFQMLTCYLYMCTVLQRHVTH